MYEVRRQTLKNVLRQNIISMFNSKVINIENVLRTKVVAGWLINIPDSLV